MTQLIRGLAVAALLLLLGAVPVYAHAELEESDPADGATITTPYTLTAIFSEEIGTDRSRIVVTDSAGTEVARGGIGADDATVMTVELPELDPGEYTAGWTAVTPDDNGVTRGEINFTVAEAATPSPTAAPTPSATAGGPSPTATPRQTVSPTPAPTPPGGGGQTASGNDILLALALAAVVLLTLGVYLFTRRR